MKNFLLEAGVINLNDPVEFAGPINGSLLISSGKKSINDFFKHLEDHQDLNPKISNWFKTVFLNYAIRTPRDQFCFCHSEIDVDYVKTTALDIIDGHNDMTDEEGMMTMPIGVKGSDEILFPWGFDLFEIEGFSYLWDYIHFLTNNNRNFSRMSVPDAYFQAVDWHEKIQQKKEKKQMGADDFKVIMSFNDGWQALKLLTPTALENETDHMGHCVGLGGYAKAAKATTGGIFSIRDKDDKAYATLEVDETGNVLQVKGVKNGAVAQTAIIHCKDFILGMGFRLTRDHDKIGLSGHK